MTANNKIIQTKDYPNHSSVNVKDYGATGDGVTDDTVAIQDAIDSSGLGSTIFFPEGHYIFTALTIDLIGLRLQGSGSYPSRSHIEAGTPVYGTVLESTSSTGDCITFNNASYGIDNNGISGMAIKGDTTGYIINQNNAHKFQYNNVFIYQDGTGDGINMFDAYITSMENCYLEKGTTNVRTGTGINIDNTTLGGLYVLTNTTVYQWDTGIYSESCENVDLYGSQLKANKIGIHPSTGTTNVMVHGSYLEGNTTKSVYVNNAASNVTIQNCFINDPAAGTASINLGQGGGADELKQFSHIYIKENYFENCNTVGVAYVGSSATVPEDIVIINNKFVGTGGGTALTMSGDSSDLVYKNNTFDTVTEKSGTIDYVTEFKDNYTQELSSGVDTLIETIDIPSESSALIEVVMSATDKQYDYAFENKKILCYVVNDAGTMRLSATTTDANYTFSQSNANYAITVTAFDFTINGTGIEVRATLTTSGAVPWTECNTNFNIKATANGGFISV